MPVALDKDALFQPEDTHEAAVAQKRSGVFGDRRADGSPCCEATYVDGVKDGPGRMFYPDAKVYAVETWRNGQLDGPTVLYYENGDVQAELTYRADALDGVCREYYPGGKIESETTWVAGKREGACTAYAESGEVKQTLLYRDDALVG